MKNYLSNHGIGTEIHYPIAPHQQQALKDLNHLSYPISEEIHATTLSLPCSFAHSEENIIEVIKILNQFN